MAKAALTSRKKDVDIGHWSEYVVYWQTDETTFWYAIDPILPKKYRDDAARRVRDKISQEIGSGSLSTA